MTVVSIPAGFPQRFDHFTLGNFKKGLEASLFIGKIWLFFNARFGYPHDFSDFSWILGLLPILSGPPGVHDVVSVSVIDALTVATYSLRTSWEGIRISDCVCWGFQRVCVLNLQAGFGVGDRHREFLICGCSEKHPIAAVEATAVKNLD